MIEKKIRYGKNNLLPAILIATGLLFFSCEASLYAKDKNIEKITEVEKVLYFKTYNQEPLEKRLKRLEKRYFGEAATGSIGSRVDKIYNLAKEQIEASNEKENSDSAKPSAEEAQYPKPKVKTNFDDPDKENEERKLAVLKARDAEITSLLKEGITLWKTRDAKKAEETFLQVIRLDPRNAEAFFSVGVIYEAQGKLEKALKSYDKAHYFNPDRMDYKDAIVSVKDKIKKGGSLDPLAKEAKSAFKRKEYMSALDLYKQLETKYPQKALYKYNIGTVHLLMKNPAVALEYYEKAHKQEPTEPRYQRAYVKLKSTLAAGIAKRQEHETAWNKFQAQKKMAGRRTQNPRSPVKNNGKPSNNAVGYLRSIGIGTQATPAGVKINTVVIGSKAAVSGIRPGDIVISVNGKSLEHPGQLAAMLSRQRQGSKAQLIIKRKGQVGQILF